MLEEEAAKGKYHTHVDFVIPVFDMLRKGLQQENDIPKVFILVGQKGRKIFPPLHHSKKKHHRYKFTVQTVYRNCPQLCKLAVASNYCVWTITEIFKNTLT